MKVNHRKTAASLWSAGSVMFPVTIVLYVFVYQPDVASDAERTAQLIEKWAFISAIWRLETIAVVMLAISSWYFATAEKNMSWFLITFAHIIMVTMYANMLGSYPAAAQSYAEVPHLFPMVFDTAVWIFGFSNFLFLTGMTFVYLSVSGLYRAITNINSKHKHQHNENLTLIYSDRFPECGSPGAIRYSFKDKSDRDQ